jgi:hypothetical protein
MSLNYKTKKIASFAFNTVLFGVIYFLWDFRSVAFPWRIVESLLLGLVAASIVLLLGKLIDKPLDRWKASIKKRRAEKETALTI